VALINADSPAQTCQSGGHIAKFGLGSRTIFVFYLGDEGNRIEIITVVVEVKTYGVSLGFDELEQFVDGVKVHNYSPSLLKIRFGGIYIANAISGNANQVSDFGDGVDGETVGIGYKKQVANASVGVKINIHSRLSFKRDF
jgi:hypothetical protein